MTTTSTTTHSSRGLRHRRPRRGAVPFMAPLLFRAGAAGVRRCGGATRPPWPAPRDASPAQGASPASWPATPVRAAGSDGPRTAPRPHQRYGSSRTPARFRRPLRDHPGPRPYPAGHLGLFTDVTHAGGRSDLRAWHNLHFATCLAVFLTFGHQLSDGPLFALRPRAPPPSARHAQVRRWSAPRSAARHRAPGCGPRDSTHMNPEAAPSRSLFRRERAPPHLGHGLLPKPCARPVAPVQR